MKKQGNVFVLYAMADEERVSLLKKHLYRHHVTLASAVFNPSRDIAKADVVVFVVSADSLSAVCDLSAYVAPIGADGLIDPMSALEIARAKDKLVTAMVRAVDVEGLPIFRHDDTEDGGDFYYADVSWRDGPDVWCKRVATKVLQKLNKLAAKEGS